MQRKVSLNILTEAASRIGRIRVLHAEHPGELPDITGISLDSSRCHPGDLFFCKGRAFKAEYAFEAIGSGAVALCLENGSPYTESILDFTLRSHPQTVILSSDSIRRAMAVCSDEFYDHPFSRITTIAVTGTKGKSTTVRMISNVINEIRNCRAATVSDLLPADSPPLTTPEAPDLFRAASDCADSGFTHLVCEVSSQSVKEERIFGIHFDYACFLNFSADHISPSEHRDIDEYFECKKKLFLSCGCAVLNSDCESSAKIAEAISANDVKEGTPERTAIRTFSFNGTSTFRGKNLRKSAEGCVFNVETEHGENIGICVTTNGLFNAENALCACAVTSLLGATDSEIFRGILISRVPGRMEHLTSADGNIDVIVDYAHNKSSFEALFSYAVGLGKKITAVFGCPGGKACCRRYQLPEVALRYSDRIILTEDDSGTESTNSIISEILSNIEALLRSLPKTEKDLKMASVSVITDRETAVISAIKNASENGEKRTVLLLGKGSERTMRVAGGVIPYAGDLDIASRELEYHDRTYALSRLLSKPREFPKKIVVALDGDARSIQNLIDASLIMPPQTQLTAVCSDFSAHNICELSLKTGRLIKISGTTDSKEFITEDGLSVYIAPRNGDICEIAHNMAVKNRCDALVYLLPRRGIMLNRTRYVKKLSLQSACLIGSMTHTDFLPSMISALKGGVGRCVLIDGRAELSLARFISGLDCPGSEIVR